MKSIFSKISLLIVAVLLTLSALIYICPMTTPNFAKKTIVVATNVCENESAANLNPENIPNCVNFHLSLITNFLSDTQFVLNIFVILSLVVFGGVLFLAWVLDSIWQSLLSQFKYLFQRYRNQIKNLIEKKILRYLGFVGSHNIA